MMAAVGGNRQDLRRTFDEVAELYDRARPGYPRRLFDDLIELGGLSPGASVLEIGCGTGQATVELARRGLRVLCVELGANLAAIARRKLAELPGARVVTADFETWDPEAARFDMVLAATSWHWLDPELRASRAAALLQPGGWLAVVGGGHVVPDGGDSFFLEMQDVYEALGEAEPGWQPPRPDDRADQREEFSSSGLFGEIAVRRYLRQQTYTAEDYISLLETSSAHSVMDAGNRETLYRAIRERVNRRSEAVIRYHTVLILTVARSAAEPAPNRWIRA